MPEGGQRERYKEKVQRLGMAHQERANGEDQEHQQDVTNLVGLLEDLAVGEIDRKVEDEHQHQGEQDISCPLHGP